MMIFNKSIIINKEESSHPLMEETGWISLPPCVTRFGLDWLNFPGNAGQVLTKRHGKLCLSSRYLISSREN